MAFILNIDTALQTASVCLSKDGESIAFEENITQGQQAAWLHNAIKNSVSSCNVSLADLDAIAVSNGPGSYTGLRIGLSSAKGICYALNIPLICINTLQLLAAAVVNDAEEMICPMIDARRMEVYTALYDKDLNIIESPHALVLNENSFAEFLTKSKVLFTGDGASKMQKMVTSANAKFVQSQINALNMLPFSHSMFDNKQFSDVAYSEPEYVKAVYTT